jgi:flagellar basal-body rod modification protein FlgD
MSISPVSFNSVSGASSRIPVQTLGQDDFLKLLITQLTSQDPMNPQKDTDFIAQMAQFSALEQSRNVTEDLAELNSRQEFSEAAALLGRAVDITATSGDKVQGVVSAIVLDAGSPRLVVNGTDYSLSQVTSIHQTS